MRLASGSGKKVETGQELPFQTHLIYALMHMVAVFVHTNLPFTSHAVGMQIN